MPLQRRDRHLAVFRLRLEQHDRAEIVPVAGRGSRQPGAGGHRVAHGVLPVGVLQKDDRQLDHLLGLQFPGRNAVQDVRVEPWRRREFDNRARVHPSLHLAGQAGHGVVRLVYDHQRPVDVHQVSEREFRPAAVQRLQPRRKPPQPTEMRLQILVVGVDLAAFGILYPQGLDRADDDAAAIADILR